MQDEPASTRKGRLAGRTKEPSPNALPNQAMGLFSLRCRYPGHAGCRTALIQSRVASCSAKS